MAQFKATVILMPNGPLKITGLPFDSDLFHTELKVEDEEVKAMLASSVSKKAAEEKGFEWPHDATFGPFEHFLSLDFPI